MKQTENTAEKTTDIPFLYIYWSHVKDITDPYWRMIERHRAFESKWLKGRRGDHRKLLHRLYVNTEVSSLPKERLPQ